MTFTRRPVSVRVAFAGLAASVLALVAWLALALEDERVAAAALVTGLLLVLAMQQLLEGSEARARASDERAALALHKVQAGSASDNNGLALLGRYGNLLIACRDLAEILQVSQQMLSQLLPESAGTIYPLIDGEGLAEATHLWGMHAAETRAQASGEDCLCMHSRRLHLGQGSAPESLCPHVIMPAGLESLAAACIPLAAHGESLGWIYLSAHGDAGFPNLPVAVAAADQLALALANLKLRQNLRDLSVRDPLTGLFNRRYLSESLGREVARSQRRQLPLAVLAFDLDRFKNFNDSYGHPAGDAVLVAFARVLQSHSRSEDIACRQGGEEFVLIMPEMDTIVALRRASELMSAMSVMDVLYEGQLLPKLTTSIGMAIFPEHGATASELLAQADQALYRAKAQGRDQVVAAMGS